jgi:hypothetical protein
MRNVNSSYNVGQSLNGADYGVELRETFDGPARIVIPAGDRRHVVVGLPGGYVQILRVSVTDTVQLDKIPWAKTYAITLNPAEMWVRVYRDAAAEVSNPVFIRSCFRAHVPPTVRQARKFRNGKGAAAQHAPATLQDFLVE